MRALLTILIILSLVTTLFAQPGWLHHIGGNLNDLDSNRIKFCLNEKDDCYFGPIEIDSTTDLSRLVHLNVTSDLTLNIKLKSLTKEFLTVNLDHVKSLTITGLDITDISNLPMLDNLESLQIMGFDGDTISIINHLPKLKIFTVCNSDKLVSVESVFTKNNMEQLTIQNCKNIDLKDSSFYMLKALFIVGPTMNKFIWNDLVHFTKLEEVSCQHIDFRSMPDPFPENLRKISISHGKTNLNTLNKLSELAQIEELILMDIDLTWFK